MNKIAMLAVVMFSFASFAAPRYNIDPYAHWYTAEQTFDGGVVISGGLEFSGMTDVSGDAMCVSAGNVIGTCAAAVFTTSVSSPDYISALTVGADDLEFKPAGTLGMTLAETSGNLTVVGDIIASGNDVTATNLKSAVTGGADDITIAPAGTTALTLAETTGNGTLVGDLVVTGGNVQALNLDSAATGGADDILINPAGVLAMTIAEGGNVTIVGDLIISGGDATVSILKTPITGGADNMDLYTGGVTSMTLEEAGGIQISKVVTVHSTCAASSDRGKIDIFSVGDTVSFCGCWQSAAATYAWVALHVGGVC